LKEEVLDRTMWGVRFGRGFGPVVRQNTECINEISSVKEPLIRLTKVNKYK